MIMTFFPFYMTLVCWLTAGNAYASQALTKCKKNPQKYPHPRLVVFFDCFVFLLVVIFRLSSFFSKKGHYDKNKKYYGSCVVNHVGCFMDILTLRYSSPHFVRWTSQLRKKYTFFRLTNILYFMRYTSEV